jgi:hypothetical protein
MQETQEAPKADAKTVPRRSAQAGQAQGLSEYRTEELLNGPVGGWMGGDVSVQYPAGIDLDRDEYVQNPER